MTVTVKQAAFILLGGIAGGIAGYFISLWLTRNYGVVSFAIPGVGVSIGASFGRCPWKWLAVICGFLGLFAGLFTAWKILASAPAHRGFGYFVTHATELPTLPLILIIAGGLIAFWFPFRRSQRWARE